MRVPAEDTSDKVKGQLKGRVTLAEGGWTACLPIGLPSGVALRQETQSGWGEAPRVLGGGVESHHGSVLQRRMASR